MLNRLLLRKGRKYDGPVCWAHPDLCRDVKREGWYATKTMPVGVGDKVRRYTPVVPDGEGGWLYG